MSDDRSGAAQLPTPEPTVDNVRAPGLLRWAGTGFAVLTLVGALGAIPPDFIGHSDAVASYTRWYGDEGNQFRGALSGLVLILAAFCFAAFLVQLRDHLRRAEVGSDRLTWLATTGGVLFLGLFIASNTVKMTISTALTLSDGYRIDSGFDPGPAIIFDYLSFWLIGGAMIGAALMTWTTARIAQRSNLLPRWVRGLGRVAAVLGPLTPLLLPFAAFLTAVWVAVVGVLLGNAPNAPRVRR